MQKKIIASLLVSPLAFNAMANITLPDVIDNTKDGNKWAASGVIGEFDIFQNDGKITCPVGGGVLSQKITVEVPGTYRVAIANPVNATLKVTYDGHSFPAAEGATSVEFEVTGKTQVTIEVSAVNASTQYSFKSASIEIVFDFAAAKSALSTSLDEINIVRPSSELINYVDNNADADDDYKAVVAKLRALSPQKTSIAGKISKLPDESASFDEKMAAYEQYLNETLQKEIDDFKKEVEAYNENVAIQDNRFKTFTANTAARDLLLGEVTSLEASLKAVTDKINADGVSDAVKAQCASDIEAITDAIAAYKTAIDEAYSNLEKADIEKPESQKTAIENQITALDGKFNQAVADEKALADLDSMKKPLSEAYLQAQITITGFTGIEGYENVFGANQAAWMNQIAAENTKGETALADTDPANAAANKAIVEEAIKNINDVVAAAQALVDGQNDAMVAAQTALGNVKTAFKAQTDGFEEDSKGLTIADDVIAEYNAQVKAINDAIDAANNKVKTEYGKNDLAADDYNTAISDINTLISDLNTFLANQNLVNKAEAQKALNELKTYIETEQKDLGVNILDKFSGAGDGTIPSLQDAINALTGANTEVITAIANAKTNADKLIGAFSGAKTAFDEFDQAIERLNRIVAGKSIVAGSTYDKVNGIDKVLTEFNAKDTKWEADYNAAAALDAQKCYDAATALESEISGYDWKTAVDNAFNAFENEATDANYQVAVAKLAAVKANADAVLPATAYTDIDKAMTDIQTELTAATATNADFADEKKTTEKVDACKKVDDAVAEALETIKAFEDNQAAYVTLNTSLGEVQTAIDDLVTFNENTALDPAKKFFADAINGASNNGSLQWQLNGAKDNSQEKQSIKTQLDEALTALSVVDNSEALKAEIDGLKTKISNMETAIQENETAHNAQLAKSQDARTAITNAITEVNNGTDPTLSEKWVSALETLRDKDLLNTDRSVTQAYAKGECAKSDALTAYDKIIEEVSKIFDEFNSPDGYAAKVIANNTQVVTDAGWTGKVQNLRAAYLDAISAYNAYRGIKNAGYKQYLTDNNVFESHAGIYDYSTKTSQLESEVQTYIENANTNRTALTAADFKTEATDKADALIQEMANAVAAMKAKFNEAGKAYYAILNGEAEGAITDATTKLTDAGLSAQIDEILKDAKANLKLGQDTYTTAMDPAGANGANIGLDMDGIATDLDKVMPIDLQTGAMAQWESEYEDALNTFNELSTELDGYEFASKDVKDAQTALFNAAKANAAALNSTAVADQTLIDNLAADITALTGYVSDAKNAVAAVKANNDGNKANEDAYNNYTGTVIPDLESKLEALKSFVNSLGGTANVDLTTAENAVNKVAFDVEANKSQLTNKETDITAAINAAETAIGNAYTAAFADEVSYLTNDLLEQAKVSFNNAKADGNADNAARLDEINTALDEIIAAVGKLPLAPSATNTPEKFQEAATGYEKDICNYIAELQQMYTPYEGETTVDGVLSELGEALGSVQESLDNAKSTLSGYEEEVQTKYNPELEKLQNELNTIKSEFEAAGSSVIAQQTNYENRIKEVGDKVSELVNDAAADQVVAKQHADSNARYDVLKGEYDELVNRFDAFKQMLQEYGIDGAQDIYDIQFYLTQSIEDLEAQKAAYTLDANSELKGGQRADYLLNLYTLKNKKLYAENLQTVANSELTSVGDVLAWNIIPDVKSEISTALATLRDQYNTLTIDIRNFIPSDNVNKPEGLTTVDGYIQQSQKIAEDAQALVKKAEESRYYPGDLNGSANGEVTVADVQILLNMIGDGTTYADLYAEDPALACAADMTGDKTLNVADVTILIQAMLTSGQTTNTFAMVRGTMPTESSIDAVLVGEDNGVRTYAINLSNNETFIAGQFDLNVEAGAEIVSVKAADRLGSHELYTYDNTDNTRVIIASMENAEIAGNDGTTVLVEVKGRSGVGISNAIFADSNSQAYGLGDKTPGTSGIDNIYNTAKAIKEAIYDAAGRALKSVQRGINIIRHSDGSVTKELRK